LGHLAHGQPYVLGRLDPAGVSDRSKLHHHLHISDILRDHQTAHFLSCATAALEVDIGGGLGVEVRLYLVAVR
jgi:hypothetical protein